MFKYLLLIAAILTFGACGSDAKNATVQNETTAVADTDVAEPVDQNCLTRIIALDKEQSTARNQATEKQSLSQTIEEYRAAMEKIDYTGCPAELEPAVQRHLEVWKNITEVTDKYPNRRGEMSALFKELEKGADGAQIKVFIQRSYDTWMEVSQIVSSNMER